ncbi:MAG: hypothetical protein NC300_07255 [Bacteroidales bacterium]|nr:hypothetical protein [Clostridium sp.]MCM1203924.1 hypothetical protein [Bacteroidales bacterium]
MAEIKRANEILAAEGLKISAVQNHFITGNIYFRKEPGVEVDNIDNTGCNRRF